MTSQGNDKTSKSGFGETNATKHQPGDPDQMVHEQKEEAPEHPGQKDLDQLVHEQPVSESEKDSLKEIDADDAVHQDLPPDPDDV